jgi:hypothetical protein
MASSIIVGVVEPNGPAGFGDSNGRWSLGVMLRPWRDGTGALVGEQIYLHRNDLTREELERFYAGFPSYAIVRVELETPPHRKTYESGLTRWESNVVRIQDAVALDQELRAWILEQRKPVTLHDEYFGTLTLDRALNQYDGARTLDGVRPDLRPEVRYDVRIDRSGDGDDAARDQRDVEATRSIVQRFEADFVKYLEATADELLTLYNEGWRQDEDEITRETFISRLNLSSLSISPRELTIYLNESDMFAGHIIEIRAERDGKVFSIGIAG